MGLKPFTTIEDQIKMLKSRNMIINDDRLAAAYLISIGYYTGISGYKKPFLKNEALEVFYPDTKIENIIELYEFDDSLKRYTFPLFTMAESLLKCVVNYEFAQCYGEDNYLELSSYNTYTSKQESSAIDLISYLKTHINKCKTNRSSCDDCIRHNLKKYKYVPIWVLFTTLPFGSVERFFSCLKPKLKREIINKLNALLKTNLLIGDFEILFKALVNYRNCCAHSFRIYNYNPGLSLKSKSNLLKDIPNVEKVVGLDWLVLAARTFLTIEEFKKFISGFNKYYSKMISTMNDEQKQRLRSFINLTPELLYFFVQEFKNQT